MSSNTSPTKSSGRVPLGDITGRYNGVASTPPAGHDEAARSDSKPSIKRGSAAVPPNFGAVQFHAPRPGGEPSAATRRISTVSKESRDTPDSRRASKASTVSSRRQDGLSSIKTHIGPWELGKTLGKGSSARVRAARHCVTHEPVAVKIVAKRTAHMTQAGSLTRLDQIDRVLPESVDGVRRMPVAIEREVAILKLIDHPNIVKLYDIWENRNEM